MDINSFLQSLQAWLVSFFRQLLPEYILPNLQLIIQVAIIFIVGYVLGKISKIVVTRVLYILGLKRITARSWTEDILKVTGYKGNIVELIGDVVKWSIYVITLAAVTQFLGFSSIAVIFSQIITFVPKFIIAILIVILGFIIADFFGKVFEEAVIKIFNEEVLSKFSGGLIKYSVSMVAIIIALALVGLDISALMLLLSALLVIIILILGLGVKDLIPNYTAGIHLRSLVKVGDSLRIGKHSGRISRIGQFSVDIKSGRKTITVPNSLLVREPFEKQGK